MTLNTALLTPLALLAAWVAPLGAAEDGAVGDLEVCRLGLNLAKGTVRMKLKVSAPEAPAWLLVSGEDVVMTVAGRPVFTLSEVRGASAKSRWRSRWRWRIRGGECRLKVHLIDGAFRLRARGVELPDVVTGPLAVELRLGERKFRASIEVRRRGHRVRLSHSKQAEPGEARAHRDLGGRLIAGGRDAVFESRVFRDAGSFATWWAGIRGSEVPEVDFDTEIAVAVVLGDRPNAGHSIELLSVERREDGALVRYRERRAGAGCPTCQNIVSPWFAVAIPKVEGDVAFRGHIDLVRCR